MKVTPPPVPVGFWLAHKKCPNDMFADTIWYTFDSVALFAPAPMNTVPVPGTELPLLNNRKFGPIGPVTPVGPVGPATPLGPVAPVTPAGPVAPVTPVAPVKPVAPVGPAGPLAPVAPVNPVGPIGPVAPVSRSRLWVR